MRVTEIRGLPVIDTRGARRLGVVSDVAIDAGAGRIATLQVDAGDAESKVSIPSERVQRIGAHAVMVTGDGSSPGGTVPPTEQCIDIDTVVGLEVLSDGGDRVGHLADAHVDPESLRVEAYELAAPFWERWLGGRGLISPGEVLACSRELMIVPSARHVAGESGKEQPATGGSSRGES